MDQIEPESLELRLCFAGDVSDGKFACAVNGNIKLKLAFSRVDLGDIDVKIADRVSLEPFPGGLIAPCFRQTTDAVAL